MLGFFVPYVKLKPMSEYIIRERLEINFAQVPKTALKDRNLSLKAKGLYSYLFSLPEDWKIFKTEIVKNFSDGKDSLNSAFKELEANGYIVSKVVRDQKTNQFTGTALRLLIEPLRVSRSGEPVNGKAVYGESAPTNIDNTNTINTNTSFSNEKEGDTLFPNDKPTRKKFSQPTISEVEIFFKLKKSDIKKAAKFFNFYESKNWMVGKNKMSNWNAAASNWINEGGDNEVNTGGLKIAM